MDQPDAGHRSVLVLLLNRVSQRSTAGPQPAAHLRHRLAGKSELPNLDEEEPQDLCHIVAVHLEEPTG